MWGTLGIVYNTEMVSEPITSWTALLDEQYAGSIFMMDSVRDTIGLGLKALGYYTGPVNGNFGPQTQEAVQTFQSLNGIKADGVAGTATLEKMFDSKALTYRLAKGTATPRPTPTPTPKPTAAPSYSVNTFLKVGASGTLVKQMQLRLIELGYLAGEATGKFNNGTLLALMSYQKRHINYADGVAGWSGYYNSEGELVVTNRYDQERRPVNGGSK